MKAVRFHEYGAPDVLRYEDVRQPVPGAGEVRIRVAATTFNGVDANIRAGNMRGPIPVVLPHIPGIDVAGTVDALGEGVDGVEVGEEVVGFLPMVADGAAAEYVLSPAETLTAAPTTVPLPDAAALPLVGLTAWQALFDHGRLTAGQRVLINGAGGAVGGYAVQLAKIGRRPRHRHGRPAQQRARQDGGRRRGRRPHRRRRDRQPSPNRSTSCSTSRRSTRLS